MKKPKSVVDLHVEAFLKNADDYSQEELLDETLDYFREMLDNAIYWEMHQIKFIHGKGKGILKNALYKELNLYKSDGLITSFHPDYGNEDIVVVQIGI